MKLYSSYGIRNIFMELGTYIFDMELGTFVWNGYLERPNTEGTPS